MAKKRRRKSAKIKSGAQLIVIIFLIIVIVCVYVLWQKGILDPLLDYFGITTESSSGGGSSSDNIVDGATKEEIISSDLSIHFLELGNKYTGDCTLIKCGDTEMLIDAGSRQSSANTLRSYIDEYCTDGVLEYVVATHTHTDHIAGFVGNKSGSTQSGILYNYEIGTIIQFSNTTKTLNDSLYSKYCTAVDYAVSQGAKAYDALQCYNETGGAKKTYYLNETHTVSFTILYNYYYDHDSTNENEFSVCLLLSDSENNYLFTGDLEADGEERLVENNSLPLCKLFKAGHHGSKTANSDKLISTIRPEIVCVCCCCGSTEYSTDPAVIFPSQAFCDTMRKYNITQIFVTTAIDGDTFQPMNGNIVVFLKNGKVSVSCSNNNTILADTKWYQDNR